MEILLKDLQFGLRMLWKSRGFTIVAVLALAIGIGANTAIFSVINSVLLRPLPYKQPEQLVVVRENFLQNGLKNIPISIAEFFDYRSQNRSFQEMAAYFPVSANLTGVDEPERVQGMGDR